MTNFPRVIYLHDGQDDITWSECEEVDGVKYIRADKAKTFPVDRLMLPGMFGNRDELIAIISDGRFPMSSEKLADTIIAAGWIKNE